MDAYFECPRCNRYVNGIQSLGKMQCSYHPGDLEYLDINGKEVCRYSCCKKRPRVIRYNAMSVMLGGQSEYTPPKVKGCKACDCGTDFEPVAVTDVAEYIAEGLMDPSEWKRFDKHNMYIHRKII